MPQIAGFRGLLADPAQPGSPPTRDVGRCIYRYHQIFAGPGRAFTRKNLIVAVGLSPWTEGMIRPHEETAAADRDAELARIRSTRTHAAPFVAGFRDQPEEVDRLLRKHEGGKPTLEHTTADGTVHRVWRIQDAELLGKLRHYFAPKKLHVLAGHDRYEAMLAYQAELAGQGTLATYSSANYGLACLANLDDPTLATAARHRIVRGAIDREALLAKARTHFIVDKLADAGGDLGKLFGALRETVAHQPAFVAVFPGERDAWKLTLSPDVSPFAEGVAPHRALQKLDPVVLDGMFVQRHLAGREIATTVDPAAALADPAAALVLLVRPLTIEQIVSVDEVGARLPAGSTAIHPPILDGLVRLAIDPDEDLV
ncbi:MAG TPA: DUF1015 family protein [Kofleriaceae bacterium]|nr:DUF1015 family protein [Kofleriaceae bacterium]